MPLISEVSSTRAVVVLRTLLPQLRAPGVPAATRDTAEQLQLSLTHADD
ncbi:MAG: hypothetical protein ACRDT0_13840 [Pseudonocardiaceae bacterium]